MSETPWTPGPWRATGEWDDSFGPTIRAADDTFIGALAERGEADVTDADARLIAKAPEMAELLEALVGGEGANPRGYTGTMDLMVIGSDVIRARELLAEIKGETP